MGSGILKNVASSWQKPQPSYGASYQFHDHMPAFHSGSNILACHSPQSFSSSSLFFDGRGSLASSSSVPDTSGIFYPPSSFPSSSLIPPSSSSSSPSSTLSKHVGSLSLENPYNINNYQYLFQSSSSSSPTFSTSSPVVIFPSQTYYGSALGPGYSHSHLPPYPCGDYISSLPLQPPASTPSPNPNSDSSYSCGQYTSPGFFPSGTPVGEYSNQG